VDTQLAFAGCEFNTDKINKDKFDPNGSIINAKKVHIAHSRDGERS
jgi:hypothetical protein